MSCCQCLKIQVLDSITGVPERFYEDGKLYLDLSRNFILELSKKLSELSQLDTINTEAAIEFSLPYTPKNNIIASFVRNHNRIGNEYSPLSVLAQEGSVNHQTFSELIFTGASDVNRLFSAKLQRSTRHWLDGAENLYLNTVNFGTFEFSAANLIDNWENNARYNDGDAGIYFPLVHYGGWFSKATMLVEDFRPWLHALAVLQKGFCEIGWNFRCPWLETDVGRQLGCYILDDKLGMDADQLDSARFYAEKDNVASTSVLYFSNVILNNGGYFYPGTPLGGSYFSALGVFNFTAVVQVDVQLFPGITTGTGTLYIIKYNEDGVEEIVGTGNGTATNANPTTLITVEAKNISLSPGQYIYVKVVPTNAEGLWLPREGFFKNDPVRIPSQKGDIISIADAIHPDYTLLQYLKGIAHPANAKFTTDWVTKTLTMYTPYDSWWNNSEVDGFYLSTLEDITNLIIEDSEEIILEKTAQARYLTLKFQDSTDAYIDKRALEQVNPLYSKEVDLGEGFLNTEQDITNPFFEPTANAVIDKFVIIPPSASPVQNVDIPHLWDNSDGIISYNIKPRLVFFQGYVKQLFDNDSSAIRYWRFENTLYSDIPWAFQKTDLGFAKDQADDVFLPRTEIVYGENDSDFYNLGYKRELLTRKFANRSGFQMLTSAQRYRTTDFRKIYKLFYNGRTFFARMLEINAYSTCGTTPAQIVLRPEPFIGDICSDVISVDPDTCSNQPRIDITYDFDTSDISAEANDTGITSEIDTDVWEYSTDDGNTWTSYTPEDLINGFSLVIFRRTVSFTDGCPTKVVTRTADFSSQCNNNPGISLSYDEGTNTIVASGTGSFNASIDTDVFEVSIDAAAYASYTEGSPINGFDTVTFRRTTNYTNSCPETIVTATYTVEGEVCDNNPTITFTQIGNSKSYVLSIDETDVNSDIAAVIFQISDNGGTTWHIHMGQLIPRYPTTIVRAFVYYSDGCPMSLIESVCP